MLRWRQAHPPPAITPGRAPALGLPDTGAEASDVCPHAVPIAKRGGKWWCFSRPCPYQMQGNDAWTQRASLILDLSLTCPACQPRLN